jgi:hypothetical protein
VEGALVSEESDVVRCAPKEPGDCRLRALPVKGESRTKTVAKGSTCECEPRLSCEETRTGRRKHALTVGGVGPTAPPPIASGLKRHAGISDEAKLPPRAKWDRWSDAEKEVPKLGDLPLHGGRVSSRGVGVSALAGAH